MKYIVIKHQKYTRSFLKEEAADCLSLLRSSPVDLKALEDLGLVQIRTARGTYVVARVVEDQTFKERSSRKLRNTDGYCLVEDRYECSCVDVIITESTYEKLLFGKDIYDLVDIETLTSTNQLSSNDMRIARDLCRNMITLKQAADVLGEDVSLFVDRILSANGFTESHDDLLRSAILDLAGACTEFCVNGLLAGNCRIVWRHNEHEETCSP